MTTLNELNRRYISPAGGALKITFWDELMVVIFFRASFPNFETVGIFY